METGLIEIIIQGGSVGLALVLIIINYKQSQNNANQVDKFTSALLEFNRSITRMEDNHSRIEQVIKENGLIIKENSEILRDVKEIIKELKP